MKKIICLLLTVVMALCTAAGCSKKTDTELTAAAGELKTECEELAAYIDSGLAQGYITQEDKDVFDSFVERIDEIINGEGAEATKEELKNIKEELAVMASKCAAPDYVVDMFVNDDVADGENSESESEDSGIIENENTESQNTADAGGSDTQQSDSGSSTPAHELSNDFNQLIDDFMELQNEASRKVDKGEVDMDDYTALLEAGTDLAALKEETEANGETDEIKQKTADVKSTVYKLASKMNSSLADSFK